MNAFVIIFVGWVLAGAAIAQHLTDSQLAKVTFEQRLNARLPLNVSLRDESGAPVRMGSFFGERPVILVFAYYDCPSLCTLVLNGLLESVRNMSLSAGSDFEIVVVSIRPDESAVLAKEKKQTYAMRYGRPGAAKGWHFLTGDAPSIRQLADAAGFRYVYDPVSKQFAHPSGITIVTPAGNIARYFFGIEYSARDLRYALVEASQNRIGTLADHLLLLLCYHYNPATGRYGWVITRTMQIAGIGTVLLLGAGVFHMSRRDRDGPASVP